MDFLKRQNSWLVSLVLALVIVGSFELLFSAPSTFVPDTLVRIDYGSSASQIATQLAQAGIIRHPIIFRALLRISNASNNLQTGVYKFEQPQNVFVIAARIVDGTYDLMPVRMTFVEGTTIREEAQTIATALPAISTADFTAAAAGQEGYLFPDTYFFQPSADATSIVTTMQQNFHTKVDPLQHEIDASGHSLSDIITMASIIEKEARTDVDRHMVAGILWNRIRLHMPLQVDAVFGYIYGRDTYAPSLTDLKTDSPYNTYLHIGLPPGPIDNPGLDSIEAAINPTKTSYLYYLTDADGVMHYATTYAGHQANLRKYLK